MDTAEHRLLARFAARVEGWDADRARLFSVLSIPALGLVDYLSGPEMAFSVFYLLPLSIIGWLSADSRFFPSLASVLAALTWIAADIAAGARYSSVLVPLWNTATRLAIFSIVVILLQNLRSAAAEQRQLAEVDALTGVANGRTFMSAIGSEIERVKRHPGPISVAYIDVDDFKTINDSQGHAGGDEVLRRLGAALDSNTRDIDVVGRLGGDEFGILLPLTDEAGARVVIENLRKRVAGAMQDLGFPVTLSLGCVTFLGTPAGTGEILHAADELMYEVKKGSKDAALHKVVTRRTDAMA